MDCNGGQFDSRSRLTHPRAHAERRQRGELAESANAPQLEQFSHLRRAAQQMERERRQYICLFTGRNDGDSTNAPCGMDGGVGIGGNPNVRRNPDQTLDPVRDLIRRTTHAAESANIKRDRIFGGDLDQWRKLSRAVEKNGEISARMNRCKHAFLLIARCGTTPRSPGSVCAIRQR